MITVQRIRVRWSAAARGAPQANARRGLCRPVLLPPSLPGGDVVVHDVLADEANGYTRQDGVTVGGVGRARDLDLWLSTETARLVVDRLPGRAAYPRQSGPGRLFTLLPGQVGRYRANFRFTVTTCACNPSWYYEDWLILVANDEVRRDEFIARRPDHDVDHRVHLYGG
ncbi:hypothetical protein ACLQ29_32775 [Micromonospora sp. DT228]|uniref:hypothetical protein n=1 Tax=Micromonospora sp. DT228 TaxID=3393443 RepID=UPI003CF8E903